MGIVMSVSAERGSLPEPVITKVSIVPQSGLDSFYNPRHADERIRISRWAPSPGPPRR